MSQVLVRRAVYEDGDLKARIFELMEAMGGETIRSGSRVLIKPNLLSPAKPEHAILTHPALVRAAAEYVLQRGARPLVADSPAIGSFDSILNMSGIRDALRGLEVECRPFQNSVRAEIGEPFGSIEIAEEALDADAIINLPKLKTHGQMLLTLAVKNLFGCVVGYRKPEWHMRAGADRQAFAKLLVGIARTLRPAFNILDGILALEGEGPGRGGIPRQAGIILAGKDPFAVDFTVCQMLGITPEELPILKAAADMGNPVTAPTCDGQLPEIRGFRLPRLTPLMYGPKILHGFIRRQLLQRPVCDDKACRMCGECWKICPAGAIAPEEAPLRFDYDRCIRCYCCLEVCQFGALRTAETAAGRFVRRAAERILQPGRPG